MRRCFFMVSLGYLIDRTPTPIPAKPEQEEAIKADDCHNGRRSDLTKMSAATTVAIAQSFILKLQNKP
jgi:hypothetical protein